MKPLQLLHTALSHYIKKPHPASRFIKIRKQTKSFPFLRKFKFICPVSIPHYLPHCFPARRTQSNGHNLNKTVTLPFTCVILLNTTAHVSLYTNKTHSSIKWTPPKTSTAFSLKLAFTITYFDAVFRHKYQNNETRALLSRRS